MKFPSRADPALEQFERQFVKPRQGRTLIVGSQVTKDKEDRRLRYSDVVGIDMIEAQGVDRVLNLEDELPDDLGLFDHVECMSVLEHSNFPWLLAANIERLMKSGATLYVTAPFVWRPHFYSQDNYRFLPNGFRLIFPNIKWEKLMFAGDVLREEREKMSVLKDDKDHPYMARTDTVGFGIK